MPIPNVKLKAAMDMELEKGRGITWFVSEMYVRELDALKGERYEKLWIMRSRSGEIVLGVQKREFYFIPLQKFKNLEEVKEKSPLLFELYGEVYENL